MWAVIEKWVHDATGGFGVLTTEECEEIVVLDAVIESDAPLTRGDRVRIEYRNAPDSPDHDTISKLVKVD